MDKEQFIEYILTGGPEAAPDTEPSSKGAVRPKGFAGKGFKTKAKRTAEPTSRQSTFAKRLLEAAGFGVPEEVASTTLIRGDDAAARHLPERVFYWPKTSQRPYQTLLFETETTHRELLEIPAFRKRAMDHLDIVEDALARLVQQALRGFERGGEGVTADIKKGRQEETLCIISVVDEREDKPVRLVCFGTENAKDSGLETFLITEATRFWEPQLARDYLDLLYQRQFGRLEGSRWQEAFTTTDERKQAQRLMHVCSKVRPKGEEIQESVLDLLDQIARSFGLRRKPGQRRRLQTFALPSDHDIGVDPSVRIASKSKKNPLQGIAIQDEKNRLLGYIVYCLDRKKDADALRSRLQKHNRFHNVLVVYPDGDQTALELWQGRDALTGKLRKDGAQFSGESEVVNLLSRFFVVSKAKVRDPVELAEELAYRAQYLRHLALRQLESETDEGELRTLCNAYRSLLVHDEDDEAFADAYAQTLTYGLLSARWIASLQAEESTSAERFSRDEALLHLEAASPFLRDLFQNVFKAGFEVKLVWLLDDIADLLDRVDIRAVFSSTAESSNLSADPVIHFYEPFLAAYDKALKSKRGVFYTPQSVVSYIVSFVHQVLKDEFGLEDGLASTVTWKEMCGKNRDLALPKGVDPDSHFVVILDPAVGTGTFLVETLSLIHRTMMAKWVNEGLDGEQLRSRWDSYVVNHLQPRLFGYEIMMAPYVMAHLKIGLKLLETGFRLERDHRSNVFLTDSLEPHQDLSGRLAFDVPALAREAEAVNAVKSDQAFTVLIGNPPYLREKERGPGRRDERIGGWVRFGDPHSRPNPLFDDFIKPLADVNKGVHAKLAYELSAIFWRLALWLVFERRSFPGIVGMISPRAYISGPGHYGMRLLMRKRADRVWVTDLGGDNRGARKSENVFDIETGVSIAVCASLPSQNPQCEVRYFEIEGSAADKLDVLAKADNPVSLSWRDCVNNQDAFLPSASGEFSTWPRLTNIFPWQHSGSQFKRLWPIGESEDILAERWRKLLSLSADDRREAFVETRDRRADSPPRGSTAKRFTGIVNLKPGSPLPRVLRYCYRSLDRQWCLADERLADFIRTSLVSTVGSQQVFAATLMSKQLGKGPAVSVTNLLPDMDVFCNRGAKDVIPLWRDAEGKEPNVTQGLLAAIGEVLGEAIDAPDLFCYCVAILGSPSYAEFFEDELAEPGPRIPITSHLQTFRETAFLGSKLVWLQTFGERWLSKESNDCNELAGSASVQREIPADSACYPCDFAYDNDREMLRVGEGLIENVIPDVYSYAVSGFKVVESWLRYRMKERGGRAKRKGTRSVLDEIRPAQWAFTSELLELLWVVEGCVDLWPKCEATLQIVMDSDPILESELPLPSAADRKEPKPKSKSASLF